MNFVGTGINLQFPGVFECAGLLVRLLKLGYKGSLAANLFELIAGFPVDGGEVTGFHLGKNA